MGEPGCTRRTHPRPPRTQAPAPRIKILLWRGYFRAIPRPPAVWYVDQSDRHYRHDPQAWVYGPATGGIYNVSAY